MDVIEKIEKNDAGTTMTLNLTLTQDEVDRLCLMLGMAMGAATRESMTELAYGFLRLTNKLMEGNPTWTPYWVPEEVGK